MLNCINLSKLNPLMSNLWLGKHGKRSLMASLLKSTRGRARTYVKNGTQNLSASFSNARGLCSRSAKRGETKNLRRARA